MSARDATAEAVWTVLFERSTIGYAVVGVRRTTASGAAVWERHALDIAEPARWVTAVETAVAHGLRMEVWPFVGSRAVLRGIGTSAFRPGRGASLRSWQSVVALVWDGAPSVEALERFVAVGGHVVAARAGGEGEHFGLLPLDEARPLGALTFLTGEVGSVLGARPLGYERALPLPGVNGAVLVTDAARALTGRAATSDDIVLARLRTSDLGRLV